MKKIKIKNNFFNNIKKRLKFFISFSNIFFSFLIISFAFSPLILAQAPPPPPPPPSQPPIVTSDITPQLNSFINQLRDLKDKFGRLKQSAAEVLRPVYFVYGKDFVPNVPTNKIDISLNNFIKEKYADFAKLYEKYLQEKYPDLKETFIGVVGEEVSVLYVISTLDKIQNAIDNYIKAINIDLNNASKEVTDNAKCFFEKVNNVPTDVKQSKDKLKKVDFGLSVFRCLMGVMKGLKQFADVNALFESTGTTFSRYFSTNALSQSIAAFDSSGNFYSPTGYPKEIQGIIEPARNLVKIAQQADTLAKLKNFVGKVTFNLIADLLNAPGNEDVKVAIGLFPFVMEDIYDYYNSFISGLQKGTQIISLNVGYTPINQDANTYNYQFDAGVSTACKWKLEQGSQSKEFDECKFTYQVAKSPSIKYKVKALGSPAQGEGEIVPGSSKQAAPPSGQQGGGNLPPVVTNECTDAQKKDCQNQGLMCVSLGNGKYDCVDNPLGTDDECSVGELQECLDQNAVGCKKISGKAICDFGGGLPPVTTICSIDEIENLNCTGEGMVCEKINNKPVCKKDGKIITPPKDNNRGSKSPCFKNPEPKEGEITIPNPLCDPGLLELIGRIVNFLQWMAVILAPLIFIVAGIMYMTSGGDVEKVKRASMMMLWSAIGFAIVLLSFGLVNVLMDLLGYQKGG